MILIFFLLGLVILAVKKVKEIKQVESFRPLVEEIIPEDKRKQQLILSIILTETKGLETDIMQSSESMSLKKDQVLTAKESIQYGVKHFDEMDAYAKSLGLDTWSSVQAYNFGAEYLNFLQREGQKTTSVKLAEKYSKDYLAPTLGNLEQKTYHYWHWQALLYNGGNLYHNGGNFFYAKIVKWNLAWLKLYEKVENFIKN